MKIILPGLILFVLLSLFASASWQNYGHFKQNNQRAYDGLSADVDGYSLVDILPGVVAFPNQPLVYDLDWDGSQEILAVRNNVMNVYDADANFITGLVSVTFGNKQPAISASTTPASIVMVGNDRDIYTYVFNGTALVMTHNQSLASLATVVEDSARCDINNGVFDCYLVGRITAPSTLARFFACDVNSVDFSNFCTLLLNTTMTSNWNTPYATLFPASNTQGGLVDHYSVSNGWGSGYGWVEDIYGVVTLNDGNVAAIEGTGVFIKRTSATDYFAFSDANSKIQVWDWTFGGKTYKHNLEVNYAVRSNYTNYGTMSSNPLNLKNIDVCGIFHPYYTSYPTPYSCPFTLLCKDLTGAVTRNVTWDIPNFPLCLISTSLKVTLADINADNKYEYFFDGVIAESDFSTVYFSRTFPTAGWMIPVDLRTTGMVDLLVTNAAGDLGVYHNGGGGVVNLTCTDTDNFTFPTVNWNVQGTVIYGGEPYTDYCAEDGSLTEFSCFNAITAQWDSHVCDVECQEGRCLTCLENWSCSDWSACTNSSQLRSCTDSNSCGTTYHRPAVTQSCNVMLPALDMPRNLVDVNNPTSFESDAFLPELWNGMMMLFSYTLVPIMILLVCIVLAALFWGLGQKMRG